MQYYVTFLDNGNISGFYVDEIHGDNIPANAILITTDQWKAYSADARLYRQADSGDEPARLKTQQELDDENAALPPPEKSPQQIRIETLETDSVNTMLGLAEVYETQQTDSENHETEAVNTMLGLAEAYETILTQATTIDALTARIVALEATLGGGS